MAVNQFIHGNAPCNAASFTASKFAVKPVRNNVDVTSLTAPIQHTRMVPIFLREPLSGKESKLRDRESATGYITPPQRAVLLGIAGASRCQSQRSLSQHFDQNERNTLPKTCFYESSGNHKGGDNQPDQTVVHRTQRITDPFGSKSGPTGECQCINSNRYEPQREKPSVVKTDVSP